MDIPAKVICPTRSKDFAAPRIRSVQTTPTIWWMISRIFLGPVRWVHSCPVLPLIPADLIRPPLRDSAAGLDPCRCQLQLMTAVHQAISFIWWTGKSPTAIRSTHQTLHVQLGIPVNGRCRIRDTNAVDQIQLRRLSESTMDVRRHRSLIETVKWCESAVLELRTAVILIVVYCVFLKDSFQRPATSVNSPTWTISSNAVEFREDVQTTQWLLSAFLESPRNALSVRAIARPGLLASGVSPDITSAARWKWVGGVRGWFLRATFTFSSVCGWWGVHRWWMSQAFSAGRILYRHWTMLGRKRLRGTDLCLSAWHQTNGWILSGGNQVSAKSNSSRWFVQEQS